MFAHDFDVSIVDRIEHRPWPMQQRRWALTQTWRDLLFAHWPLNPTDLRRRIPRRFELDLFDGRAWLGIVPFSMSNVGLRGLPSLPGVSTFPELNVRTYVRVDSKPGVYFFSLDANSWLAVTVAQRLLNLPYHLATMETSTIGERIEFSSTRAAGAFTAFTASYGPAGNPFVCQPGTLEYFLTERYCLYHHTRGGIPYRLDIHHPPWTLQSAWAEFPLNSMATANGLALSDTQPLLHFAKRQDVVAWTPVRLRTR
jgi:uncharacterized protein YqjF (DUF2071 family)